MLDEMNTFLFALPTCAENQIRLVNACQAIRKFSELCGAKNPESLRGTTMRKHMATTCIHLELNDNSVAQVADFMGHHNDIHRNHYRVNPMHNEMILVSQFLEKALGRDEDDSVDDSGDCDCNDVHCRANVVPATVTTEMESDMCELEKENDFSFENETDFYHNSEPQTSKNDSPSTNDSASTNVRKHHIADFGEPSVQKGKFVDQRDFIRKEKFFFMQLSIIKCKIITL